MPPSTREEGNCGNGAGLQSLRHRRGRNFYGAHESGPPEAPLRDHDICMLVRGAFIRRHITFFILISMGLLFLALSIRRFVVTFEHQARPSRDNRETEIASAPVLEGFLPS